MEALVALGLASNVVQFVDFASKIVSRGVKIYREKPGTDKDPEGSSLEQITKALEGHNRNLVKALDEQSNSTSGAALASPAEQDLVQICVECQKIILKLLDLLEKLKTSKPTAWNSLVAALKTVWNEAEIKALEHTLDSYRQQIALYLLASVRDEIRIFKSQQVERESALAQQQERNTKEVLSSVKETRKTVEKFFDKMKAPHGWQETVIDAMREDYDAQHSSYLRSSPATGMVAQMKKEDLEQFDKGLLRWIRFSEVDDRQTKISEAYHKTFDWIFRHPPHNAWSNFSTWLISESEPLYWITGKPAAGKSTLMKFLHADPRTLQLLSHWAGAKKLIFCPFYFWNSGTNLQMSQEGMARTLLYKTLQQAPELWAILFPQHMEEYIAYGNPWHRPITWELLTDAFQRLVNGAGPNYRLFFFIDGLDEFDGDHQRLVSLIQGFISPHVKTCVSSRPWNVFQDNFRRRPSLRLEDITYGDIKYYVTSRFQSNVGFEDRRRETPYEARELIENIIRKASGVFLWVALVTDSLLEGLSDGDRLSELQARLDALPPDLETLFWKILTNLGDRHFKRTSQVLQIIQASVTQLDILTLSYADEEDPDLALKMPFGELPAEQADARAQNLCRRLNGSCKGLLEWRAPEGVPLAWAKVGYLHRTVKDYVERPDVWHKLLEITDESFDPFSRLCGALISVLKVKHRYPYQSLSTFWGYLWDHVTFAIEYAVRADPDCESGRQVRFLNELDSVAAKIASDQSQYKVGAHGHVRKGNIIHWSDGKGGSLRSTAFLHLAVLLRLTPYIRTTARSVRDKKVLNYALLIAVELSVPRSETELSYVRNFESCPSLKSLSKIPPLEIIQILLHHGADPNAKLNALSGWDSPPPWETFLAEFNDVSDQGCARKIGQMMLDHGALPTLVKQDVDKELYSFARQKKRASRMGGIMMFGTKIKSRMTGAKPSVT